MYMPQVAKMDVEKQAFEVGESQKEKGSILAFWSDLFFPFFPFSNF
jgi:hypothetical protein